MKTFKTLKDLEQGLAELGEIQRELDITKTELSEAIADLQKKYAPLINQFTEQTELLNKQITDFCNKNYSEVFPKNSRTAKLITGEISIRQKPISLNVVNFDLAMQHLKEQGLSRFIRVKEDFNKAALLSEPAIVENTDGLEIKRGEEQIIIKPYKI